MTSTNPFKGKSVKVVSPMRVIRRFTKAGNHLAELRERRVTRWRAIEWLLFVDNALIESRLYHGERCLLYADELAEVVTHLRSAGWQENAELSQDLT